VIAARARLLLPRCDAACVPRLATRRRARCDEALSALIRAASLGVTPASVMAHPRPPRVGKICASVMPRVEGGSLVPHPASIANHAILVIRVSSISGSRPTVTSTRPGGTARGRGRSSTTMRRTAAPRIRVSAQRALPGIAPNRQWHAEAACVSRSRTRHARGAKRLSRRPGRRVEGAIYAHAPRRKRSRNSVPSSRFPGSRQRNGASKHDPRALRGARGRGVTERPRSFGSQLRWQVCLREQWNSGSRRSRSRSRPGSGEPALGRADHARSARSLRAEDEPVRVARRGARVDAVPALLSSRFSSCSSTSRRCSSFHGRSCCERSGCRRFWAPRPSCSC
jgi:hypothetical protein